MVEFRRGIAVAALTLAGMLSARAEAPSIKIGVLTDLQGVFADASGQGSVTAVEMAVEDYRKGGGATTVAVVVADYQNKADVGSSITRQWFDREDVDAIVDVANSSVALAVSEITRQHNKVFLATGPATSELTGEQCSPNTIQWYDNYMLASAISTGLAAEGPKKWFFVTADYAFGRDLQRLSTPLIEKSGSSIVGTVRHPLGTNDFSSFLLSASASNADIIALADAGSDVVNAIKQANEYQILSGAKRLVAFLAPINTINALGLQIAQRLIVTEPFYWDLNDRTRAFAARYFERFKRMPNFVQAAAYSAVSRYLTEVDHLSHEKIDPKDGRQLIAGLKRRPWSDSLFGETSVRRDGRVIHQTYLFQVKTPVESKKPWDYYNLLQTVSGVDSALSLEKSACRLTE